jgi:hypothetical protein
LVLTSPDRNENPGLKKAIFSCQDRATNGSSCTGVRKKAF